MLRAALLAACLVLTTTAQAPNFAHLGRQAVSELASGQFAAVEKQFEPQFAATTSEQLLEVAWMHLGVTLGHFIKITNTVADPYHGQQLVVVTCQMQKGALEVQWTFDAQGRISDLHFH
ncbi:MAG: hypothetical protein ACRD04_00345 [Terriglobales bacterium]